MGTTRVLRPNPAPPQRSEWIDSEVPAPVSKHSVPSFKWAAVCDGWTLLDTDQLHVVEQRMPPGTTDLLHAHEHVRQLYFILAGKVTVEAAGETAVLAAGQALRIDPRTPHRMANRSREPVEFLVISSAPPRSDRRDLEGPRRRLPGKT